MSTHELNVNKCNKNPHYEPKERPVDRAAKKRILLSTTTKGLVQWYLSTHLDSSSRLDRNRSYWRAPLSPRASGTDSVVWRERDEEGDGHLSCRVASHWAGPGQGASLRCALCWWGPSEGSHCSRVSRLRRALATTRAPRGSPYVITTNRIGTAHPIIDCEQWTFNNCVPILNDFFPQLISWTSFCVLCV